MEALLLIPLFAALNRAAGWNPIEDWIRNTETSPLGNAPKWMFWARKLTSDGLVAGYAGAVVGLYILATGNYTNWPLSIITFAGWWIWRAPGWSPMFHAFNGRPYVGTGILSRAVGSVLGDYPQTAGTVYGGLRGFLGIVPWAAGIGVYSSPLAGVALLVAGLSMGGVYWLAGAHQRATGQDTGIKRSEWAFGALLGACMALGLWG